MYLSFLLLILTPFSVKLSWYCRGQGATTQLHGKHLSKREGQVRMNFPKLNSNIISSSFPFENRRIKITLLFKLQ